VNVKARFRFSDFGRIINRLPEPARQTGVVNVYADHEGFLWKRHAYGIFSSQGCDVEELQSKALLPKGNYKTCHVCG